ncbi:hypothetical protein [Deinococcus sonorensis]|uniref:Uncharacterized protein n=2 Tax=Deinococcus sonorensis TaxID=309891 RepID=A0AAU7UDD6_9DEIO
MNAWRWLTTPHPDPGFSRGKIGKIALRFLLFLLLLTLVQFLLNLTPLRPYLQTWWGSALVVLLMYVPFFRFLTLDTPGAGTRFGAPPPSPASTSRVQRRREKNRYAGVRKAPPRGGRR